MEQLVAFLLKSIIVSAILFGYYLLFLRNRPMNRFNRVYLLCGVAISVVVPFLHFEWYSVGATSTPAVNRIFEIVNNNRREVLPVVSVARSFSADKIVWALYAVIALALLARAGSGIISLYRVKSISSVDKIVVVSVIYTDLSNAPFSFMNNIFWNSRIDINSPEGQRVLKHEMAHIEQRHTGDKLFLQLVCALFWVNPVYWLIRKELSMVHEFLADGSAIEDGDADSFAAMLLQSRFGISRPSVVNSFYFSPIKRRLTMLTNTGKTSCSALRKLSALPLALMAFGLFSFTIRKAAVKVAAHKVVVMLDAGHGGNDVGGANSSGLVEKDLVLKLTARLEQLAPGYNITILQTRNNDKPVTLNQRAEASNKSNADVYLSIHINKAGPGSKVSNGYMVYVSDASPHYADSKLLATRIANSLYTIGIKPEIENRSLVVLKANNHPAILVECGDIDNVDDMARLKDPRRMDELCGTLLGGVVAYANNRKQ